MDRLGTLTLSLQPKVFEELTLEANEGEKLDEEYLFEALKGENFEVNDGKKDQSTKPKARRTFVAFDNPLVNASARW